MIRTHTLVKNDNKLFSWGIALLCCTIIFVAIEIKYPFFFLRDDNADSYIAEYTYGISCLADGNFPFFCFNEYCGQRFFAMGQVGIFNPLIHFAYETSRLILGKPDMMMDILAYLSIIIGCTGSFFLLKRLNCSDTSAVIGSIAWNFNCYNIWEGTSWILVPYTTSVFPFFLLTSLLLLEKSNMRNIFLAVIPRVYLFYLGHPQFFIYAAIFDCIFIGVMCLIRSPRGKKIRLLLLLIKDYLIVYISTTFLALPLLIPEYQYSLLTFDYGSARTYENLLYEMWVDPRTFYFPFLYTETNNCYFYPPFIGYLLFGFLIAGFFLPIFILRNKSYSRLHYLVKSMLAVLPCLTLSYLILFNYGTLRIISYIPILNRFQYYHRTSIFFTAFEIIFACLSMTVIESVFKKKYKVKLAEKMTIMSIFTYFLILIEVLGFGLLYTCMPHLGRGPMFDTSKRYDYDFASQFKGGRYMTAGFSSDDTSFNMDIYDLSENLNYNLAKLYGINNISGYAGVLNYRDVIWYNECYWYMQPIMGSVQEYYPGMIEQMREQSVNWYIIPPQKKNEYEDYFKEYGIEFVTETEYSAVYYDPNAQPYAYDDNENEVSLVQGINTLTLHTDKDFAGGSIILNYTYDPNFRCYIDGSPATIYNDPEHWQFAIECASGAHEILIRYEDSVFTTCCILTCGYICTAGLSLLLYRQWQKRKNEVPAT